MSALSGMRGFSTPYPGLRLRVFSSLSGTVTKTCDQQTAYFCHLSGTRRLLGRMYDTLEASPSIV
jgi:hypothetical protein